MPDSPRGSISPRASGELIRPRSSISTRSISWSRHRRRQPLPSGKPSSSKGYPLDQHPFSKPQRNESHKGVLRYRSRFRANLTDVPIAHMNELERSGLLVVENEPATKRPMNIPMPTSHPTCRSLLKFFRFARYSPYGSEAKEMQPMFFKNVFISPHAHPFSPAVADHPAYRERCHLLPRQMGAQRVCLLTYVLSSYVEWNVLSC